MKLNILSDLHLSLGTLEIPENDADVVILAGDIAPPRDAVSWALGFAKPVLYFPGNHEFYGGDIGGTVRELRQLCAGTDIHVLDNDEVMIQGVRFLGTTLWTDFMLFGDGEKRVAAMAKPRGWCVTSLEFVARNNGRLIHPTLSSELFATHANWLDSKLTESYPGSTVVIRHHAPSRKSIHPRFADSLLNACFVSDGERLTDGSRVRLWVHGHTHDSFDYVVNGTRVVCNPRGYAANGVNENPHFNADFLVEID